MAWQVNNVVLRNLQEQVEKNKQDIAKHYEIDRVLSDWGIKVLGVVNTPSDIPEGIYEYGDAYGVRTGSGIVYYVWTRANINVGQDEDYWLDIGALSIIGPTGPQGLQGPQGIQGVRGSLWVSSTTAPTSQVGNNGDQWLNTTTGDVYQKGTSTWTRTGNIKGPQGVQGPVGPQGVQGIQGPTGSQGPKGDTGSSFKIGGLLNSIDNLPVPTEANRSIGYAVARQDNTYDLYVVVGTGNLQWVNMGRVEGVEGPQGPVGPQGPAGADIQIVSITGIPSTATSGTLTQEQVQTLLAHPGNYIQFFNENFYPQDVEIEQGYIVYSHVGQIGSETKIKNINLTIATGGWVLTETSLVSAPISIVNELPEANEENFEKGKIYTTGELLQYISKVGDIGTLKAENIGALEYATFSTAAAVGNKIYYVSGGQNASMSNKIIVYDIETKTSETLATTMPQPAIYRQAISVGKNIYIFGGTTSWDNLGQSANISSIYKLDTSNNSISVVGSLPKALFMSYIGCVDKNIYIFGGCTSADSNFGANAYYSASIYKFNTENNEVTKLAVSLPTEIANGACVSKDKKIYIIGGQKTNSYTYYNYIYVFDAETETISSLSINVGNIYGGTAQIIGNKIYIMGSSLKEINLEDNSIVTLTLDNYISGVGRPSVLIGNNIYNLSGGAGINKINSSILKFFIDFTTFKYTFKTIATQ